MMRKKSSEEILNQYLREFNEGKAEDFLQWCSEQKFSYQQIDQLLSEAEELGYI